MQNYSEYIKTVCVTIKLEEKARGIESTINAKRNTCLFLCGLSILRTVSLA